MNPLLILTGIIILTIVVLIVMLIKMYNSLIARKNQVQNIFSSVDVLLKKRYDLIPNLVSTVSRYMAHEKEILQKITELRAQVSKPHLTDEQKIAVDNEMSSALGKVMVSVENYPELKANESFLHLQRILTEIEAQISAARRAYNQAVTEYNNALEMFPSNIMAGMMGYIPKKVFEIQEVEQKNVNVMELFNK